MKTTITALRSRFTEQRTIRQRNQRLAQELDSFRTPAERLELEAILSRHTEAEIAELEAMVNRTLMSGTAAR